MTEGRDSPVVRNLHLFSTNSNSLEARSLGHHDRQLAVRANLWGRDLQHVGKLHLTKIK